MSSENFEMTKIKVGAKPFTRPRDDRVIFGVCSGLARKLEFLLLYRESFSQS